MNLPPLPPTIYPLNNEDSFRVDQMGSADMANCLTCGGTKKFRWYVYASGIYDSSTDEVGYECPCIDQWLLHRHLLSSGILVNYQRYSIFDSRSSEVNESMSEYIDDFDAYIRNGLGMILHGSSGTGKTLSAVLIAKALILRGVSVHFATFNELISSFAAGWHNEESKAWFYKKIKNASVLIIDDVGKEMKSQGSLGLSRSVIDEVLRHRVGMSKPTFITTNSTMEDMSKLYGLSVLSLLSESSIERTFTGEDYRRKVAELKLDETRRGLTRPVVLV